MGKLRQLEASKKLCGQGPQHENELLQKVTKETLLQTEKGLNSELRRDKESIQKQLELVTLRLPALKLVSGRDLWRSKKKAINY